MNQVARTVAQAKGWTGRRGGWIYDAQGRVICQGWARLSSILTERGFVTEQGIHWRRMDLANFHA